MTLGEQLAIVQKLAGNFSEDLKSQYISYLNAEYELQAEAYPHKRLQNTGTLATVSGQQIHTLAADCGRIIRCRNSTGSGGYDGKGTILVRSRDFLYTQYPDFATESDAPRVISPWGYDDSNLMEACFQALPDAIYTLSYDYYKKITAITDEAESMAVSTGLQYIIALLAARTATLGDTDKQNNINRILEEKGFQVAQANQQGPDDEAQWQFDQVHEERREELYSRFQQDE